MDISQIRQAARIIHDEQGKAAVLVPLNVWEKVMTQLDVQQQPQHERLKAVLAAWEQDQDDTPQDWWDEFDKFLQNHRVNFPKRHLGLGDE